MIALFVAMILPGISWQFFVAYNGHVRIYFISDLEVLIFTCYPNFFSWRFDWY